MSKWDFYILLGQEGGDLRSPKLQPTEGSSKITTEIAPTVSALVLRNKCQRSRIPSTSPYRRLIKNHCRHLALAKVHQLAEALDADWVSVVEAAICQQHQTHPVYDTLRLQQPSLSLGEILD